METLICWWGQRSHIKVKGHLRSSCKIGWKCKCNKCIVFVHALRDLDVRCLQAWLLLLLKVASFDVKVASLEKFKSYWSQTWFIDTIWDPLYVYVVKGHIPRSKVVRGQVGRWAQNVKFTSFEKLEVRLEPNLVYWYNVGTFTCLWGHRSQMKVKGHVRSICRRAWKYKIWLICILEDMSLKKKWKLDSLKI